MKYFRLRPVHWFSAGVLIFLMIGLIRPQGSAVKDTAATPGHRVTAYRVVSNADDQWLEPFTVRLPPRVEPMAGALRVMTLLKPEESPLPPGTRVLSVTLRENGVAWADFNAALVTNFPGGSGRESLLLEAILRTLGQFPDVRAVQITIEGKGIESIGGHVDLSEPQSVPGQNESAQAVIR
jgi:spore germination protein GerM